MIGLTGQNLPSARTIPGNKVEYSLLYTRENINGAEIPISYVVTVSSL